MLEMIHGITAFAKELADQLHGKRKGLLCSGPNLDFLPPGGWK